jgi:hypothetical protein
MGSPCWPGLTSHFEMAHGLESRPECPCQRLDVRGAGVTRMKRRMVSVLALIAAMSGMSPPWGSDVQAHPPLPPEAPSSGTCRANASYLQDT